MKCKKIYHKSDFVLYPSLPLKIDQDNLTREVSCTSICWCPGRGSSAGHQCDREWAARPGCTGQGQVPCYGSPNFNTGYEFSGSFTAVQGKTGCFYAFDVDECVHTDPNPYPPILTHAHSFLPVPFHTYPSTHTHRHTCMYMYGHIWIYIYMCICMHILWNEVPPNLLHCLHLVAGSAHQAMILHSR